MRKHFLKSALCLLMALVCNVAWAEKIQPSTTFPDKGVPEHVYTMMNGNNVYANGLTAPTQTEANYGQFAFYAVDGVKGAYYIYSHTAKKWLTYNIAGSYSNMQDFVTMADSKGADDYFYVENYTGDFYQIRPYNTAGVAGKYLNWYRGVDFNPLDGSNTLGLWQDNATNDNGSRYSFTEIEIEIETTEVVSLSQLSNDKVYTLQSARAFLFYHPNFTQVVSSTGKAVGTSDEQDGEQDDDSDSSFAEPDNSTLLNGTPAENLKAIFEATGPSIITSMGRAMNITDEQYEEIKNFTTDLVKNKSSQTDQYREIFKWIVSNISYGQSDPDPYAVFVNKKCVCQGYANLLTVMCHTQGIPTVVVNGYLSLPDLYGGHAWAYTNTDGNWEVSDPTNGGSYPMSNTGDYTHLLPSEADVDLFTDDCAVYRYYDYRVNVDRVVAKSNPLIVPYSVGGFVIGSFNPSAALPEEAKDIYLGENIETLGETYNMKLKTSNFGEHLQAIHVDEDNQYLMSHKGVVYKRNGDEKQLYYIPGAAETLEFLPMEKVDKETVKDHQNVKVIYFPEGCTSFEPYAIENCPKLEKVYIPEGVDFPSNALYNCPQGVEVIHGSIPNSVTIDNYSQEVEVISDNISNSLTLDKTNPNHQFRIEKKGDNYYLYSVGAKKYVAKDGTYSQTATDALVLTDVSGTYAEYPWKLTLGGNGMNSQETNQTNEGIIFNSWNNTDPGNCYKIEVGIMSDEESDDSGTGYIVDMTTGTFAGSGNYRSSWTYTTTDSNPAALTLSCGGINNMNSHENLIQLHSGQAGTSTYSLTVPEGYIITSYSFDYAFGNSGTGTKTLKVGDKEYPVTADKQTLSIKNINATTTSFELSGSNQPVKLINFVVKIKKDLLAEAKSTAKAEVKDNANKLGEALGYYSYAANGQKLCTLDAVNAAIDAAATMDAVTAITESFSLNLPEVGKYYRIKGNSGNYIDAVNCYSGDQMGMKSNETCDYLGTIFLLDEGNRLKNAATKTYVYDTRHIGADKAAANTWTFEASPRTLGHLILKSNGGSPYLHDNSGNRADRCSSDAEHAAHDFILEETTLPDDGGDDGGDDDQEVTSADALPGDGILRYYRLAIGVTKSAYDEDLGSSYDKVKAFWQECEKFVNKMYIPLGMCFDVVVDESLVMSQSNLIDYGAMSFGTELLDEAIGSGSYDVGIWVKHCDISDENTGLAVDGGAYLSTTKGNAYAMTDMRVVAHEMGHLFGAIHTTYGEGSLMDNPDGEYFSYPTIKTIRDRVKGTQSYKSVKVNNNAPQFDTEKMQKTYRIPQGACLTIDVQATDIEGHKLMYTAIGCNSSNVDDILGEYGMMPSFASFAPQESNIISYSPIYTADINYEESFYLKDGTGITKMDPGSYPLSILVNDVPSMATWTYTALEEEPFYSTYAIWEAQVEIVEGEAFNAALSPAKSAYTAGDKVAVTWGVNKNYFANDSKVRISLSDDYGKTFDYVLAEEVSAHAGSCTVTLPNVNIGQVDVDFTTAVRRMNGGVIKVEEIGGPAFTLTALAPTSDKGFTISGDEETVNKVTSSISSHEIGTFYANEPMTIPAGVTAYVATEKPEMDDTEGSIVMTAISDGIIPAETGVVIRGREGTYTFIQAKEQGTEVTGNLMRGYAGTKASDFVTFPEDGSVNYVLTVKNGVAGFYRKTAGFNVANHKAYLNVPTEGKANALRIRFADDEGTTEIENVETTDNGQQTTAIYDLTGRRIEKIVEKGMYIVNGKKVIF